MTTPARFMTASIEIERKIGKLYGELSERFSANPELSELFERLSEEEFGHAKALEMVSRVLRGFKGKFEVTGNFDQMEQVLNRDLDRMFTLLRAGRELDPATALKIAVKLESTMVEEQALGLFETDSEELVKTFQMIHSETRKHKKKLIEFTRDQTRIIPPVSSSPS